MTVQPKIMIVEDDPLNMELAVDLLEVSGYRVVKAPNAEEALAMVHREAPDLILMDIALPGMDGVEAMARLQKDKLTAHIPVLAFTASVMITDHDKLRQLGCREIIAKPINTHTFVPIIAGHLEASLKRGPT